MLSPLVFSFYLYVLLNRFPHYARHCPNSVYLHFRRLIHNYSTRISTIYLSEQRSFESYQKNVRVQLMEVKLIRHAQL